MTIKSKLIKYSINPSGNRIATFELEYPRFIHAQILTHRVFSRNAQSSRASRSFDTEYIPVFRKEQRGMVAAEVLEPDQMRRAREAWLAAVDYCTDVSKSLYAAEVHKQWANRPLDWCSTIKTLVTSTAWQNFFELRLPEDTQPEIQELAKAMFREFVTQEPVQKDWTEWHSPYSEDLHACIASCARVSVGLNDFGDLDKNRKFVDRLWSDGHHSPFEHRAQAIGGYHANYRGWLSYRKKEFPLKEYDTDFSWTEDLKKYL